MVCPDAARLMAAAMVRRGALCVPAAESDPDGATNRAASGTGKFVVPRGAAPRAGPDVGPPLGGGGTGLLLGAGAGAVLLLGAGAGAVLLLGAGAGAGSLLLLGAGVGAGAVLLLGAGVGVGSLALGAAAGAGSVLLGAGAGAGVLLGAGVL